MLRRLGSISGEAERPVCLKDNKRLARGVLACAWLGLLGKYQRHLASNTAAHEISQSGLERLSLFLLELVLN